jgi:hypothetical protein
VLFRADDNPFKAKRNPTTPRQRRTASRNEKRSHKKTSHKKSSHKKS